MLADTLQNILDNTSDGCTVAKWIAGQSPEVINVFEQLKSKEGINIANIYRAIIAEEKSAPFGRTLFGYHMKGECSCPQA